MATLTLRDIDNDTVNLAKKLTHQKSASKAFADLPHYYNNANRKIEDLEDKIFDFEMKLKNFQRLHKLQYEYNCLYNGLIKENDEIK